MCGLKLQLTTAIQRTFEVGLGQRRAGESPGEIDGKERDGDLNERGNREHAPGPGCVALIGEDFRANAQRAAKLG